MRILAGVAILMCFSVLAFILGVAAAGGTDMKKMARRNGFSRVHRRIYGDAIGVLNKIVNAHLLDDNLDDILRGTRLSDPLRTEAEKVISDYRKEIDA